MEISNWVYLAFVVFVAMMLVAGLARVAGRADDESDRIADSLNRHDWNANNCAGPQQMILQHMTEQEALDYIRRHMPAAAVDFIDRERFIIFYRLPKAPVFLG